MNMDFKRKLPIPKDIKEMFPISEEYQAKRDACDKEIKAILDGSDDRLRTLFGGQRRSGAGLPSETEKGAGQSKRQNLHYPKSLHEQTENDGQRL